MSAQEIARRFELPVSTVYWLADTGKLPFVDQRKAHYQRRRLRFDVEQVRSALDRLRGERPTDQP